MSYQNSLSNETNSFEKLIINKKTIKYLFVFFLFWVSQNSSLFAQAAKFHVDVGLNYLNKNQYIEAYQEFNKALEKDPSCAEAHYNLGKVYKAQGAVQDAITEFQKALSLKPDYAEAKRELKALNVSPIPTSYSQNNENKSSYSQQTQTTRNKRTERPQNKESIVITSVTQEEVYKNPNKYIGKYVEWGGKVEYVYKTKFDLMIIVNTNPKVNAKKNMDYCYLVVFPEVKEEYSNQIPTNANITVKGKIVGVHKIYFDTINESKGKQPILKPVQLEVSDNNYSTSINISF